MTQFFFGIDGGIEPDLLLPPSRALGLGAGDTFEHTGTSQHEFLLDLETLLGGPQWAAILMTVIDPTERPTAGLERGEMFSQGVVLAGEIKVKTNFFDKPGQHHVGGLYKNIA